MRDGRQVSVCELDGAFRLRMGSPDELELALPQPGAEGDVTVSRSQPSEEREIVLYGFWQDGQRYTVEIVRTASELEGRVLVRQGAAKLHTLLCTAPITADLGELPRPTTTSQQHPWAWIGTWTAGSNLITIDQDSGSLIVTQAEALWVGDDPNHTELAHAAGALRAVGSDLLYRKDGCEITMTLTAADRMTVSDNQSCGGTRVSFSGHYHRVP